MKTTTIYLTRHGQTQWNIEERMQGWQDSPLTEYGIRQATWLRDALKQVNFEAIYTSSVERTRQTAEILRHQRRCELIAYDNLREINLGEWEGYTKHDIQLKYPDAYHAFWNSPDLYCPVNKGESFHDLQRRVLPLVHNLITKHEGQTILIVTHTATLKLIMSHFEKRPLSHLWHPPFVHPTALCKVLVADQQTSIALYGDISHYQD